MSVIASSAVISRDLHFAQRLPVTGGDEVMALLLAVVCSEPESVSRCFSPSECMGLVVWCVTPPDILPDDNVAAE
jgi:hypothetical protein